MNEKLSRWPLISKVFANVLDLRRTIWQWRIQGGMRGSHPPPQQKENAKNPAKAKLNQLKFHILAHASPLTFFPASAPDQIRGEWEELFFSQHIKYDIKIENNTLKKREKKLSFFKFFALINIANYFFYISSACQIEQIQFQIHLNFITNE